MTLTRRANVTLQEKIELSLDIAAAVAATTTFPLATMDGAYEVDKIEISVPGGVTQDPAAYYVVSVQVGATVLAQYSFQTGQQGTLASNTFGAGVRGATFSGVQGDQLNIVCTKNSTAANLPVQTRVVVHLHQL